MGKGNLIGHTENPNPNLNGRFILEVDDHDEDLVDTKYKAVHWLHIGGVHTSILGHH